MLSVCSSALLQGKKRKYNTMTHSDYIGFVFISDVNDGTE